MAKVIIWGTGQIAEVLHYYLTDDSKHQVCAFCVDKEYKDRDSYLEKPVIAFEDLEKEYPPSDYQMAVIIGYKRLNKAREEKYKMVKEKGYRCISYINSVSTCNALDVGENTFIFSNNDIQPLSKIGNNVIIWSSNSIGHHTVINDNCFLSSTKISGMSNIGKNCFLGTGSSVADNVRIGDFCVIGTGSVVTADIAEGSILAVKQTALMPVKSFDMEDILG